LSPRSYQGGRLTEAELLSTAITLFLGGHDTTTQLLALGMSALVREPAQLALLRERPDLVPAAVEEMLRYDAPFQMNLRYVVEDTEIVDVTLRAGDLVRQALGSADRDPAASRSRCLPDRTGRRHGTSASVSGITSA
jgi:cytochrome P450